MNSTRLLPLIFLCFCQIIWAQTPPSIENQIDQIFQAYDNPETPGMAVGFIKDGKLQFSKSYGMANLEHQIPISDTSAFSLASVSKQFTVLAILLLEEEGLLSIDDDIRKYLPELKDFGTKITIKMLANHTSGLRGHLNLLGLVGFVPDNVITKATVHDMVYRQEDLDFTPGTQFSYSNTGYFLMAEIVAKVSGQSFPEFMQQRIFQPLGMKHSFVMDDYHLIVKNRAASYGLWGGIYDNSPANYSYYGSSNLYTTLQDLAKWALNFEQPKVGSQAIFDQMNTVGVLTNGEKIDYALGQFNKDFKGLTHIHHSGGDAGYRAFLGRFPAQQAAVLLLSNNGSVYAEGKAMEVVDVFLKSFYKEEKTPELNPQGATSFTKLKPQALEKWAGNYLNAGNFISREIFIKNDTLRYARPEQGNRQTALLPINQNTFQLGLNSNFQVVFSDGKQQKMRIVEEDKTLENYETYESVDYTSDDLKQFTGQFYSKELDIEYQLYVQEEKLYLQHQKIGEIELESVKKDVFVGNNWRFQGIIFERNKQGLVKGFRISADRAKNVRFVKH